MLSTQITIFSPIIPARLQFTCGVIFGNLLGVPFNLIDNKLEFEQVIGAKINYSAQVFNFPALNILPASLLFEKDIKPFEVAVGQLQNEKILFPVRQNGYYSFDIFSAVFFMISRYEEYLPFMPDQYGRFTEAQSISGKNGFTQKPVVNIWVKMLAEHISRLFEDWQPVYKKGSVLFTYDIDVAYAYRGRSLTIHLLSFAKDILSGNIKNIKAKLKTRFGKKNDPFDTYPLIAENPVAKQFFFLLAQKRGTYDKNISTESTDLKELIKHIYKKNVIGIHPSYWTSEQSTLFKSEKKTLEQLIGSKVEHSRQHFLRLRFPDTYRQLIAVAITHDYSLAYAEKPGFRAGICSPYPFFDLVKNEPTNLIIHPTCIMDSCFRDDLHMTAAESLPVYIQMLQAVTAVGGEFVCIWHNDLLAERANENHPLNFRKTYLDFTAEVVRLNV